MAATNEALRKVDEESANVMGKLTGGLGSLGGLGGGLSVLMDYYSKQISQADRRALQASGGGK